MNQYNEISTLQYMGSKTRIISHICEPIIKTKSIKAVVDLFAGTGSVGYALKTPKNIISNDLEYYAYIINHAILNRANCTRSCLDMLIGAIISEMWYHEQALIIENLLDMEQCGIQNWDIGIFYL